MRGQKTTHHVQSAGLDDVAIDDYDLILMHSSECIKIKTENQVRLRTEGFLEK